MNDNLKKDPEFLLSTPAFHARVPEYLRNTFLDTHSELMSQGKYDCNLSGSTVCAVFFDSKKVYCANAGDSRAVLFSQGKKQTIKVTPLSEDHKPSLPNEKKRVLSMNGRVEPIQG